MFMRYLLRNYKNLLLRAFFFISLSSLMPIALHLVRGGMLGAGLAGDGRRLFLLTIILFLGATIRSAAHYWYSLCYRNATTQSMRDMRKNIFHALLGRSFRSFLQREQGEYLALFSEQMKTWNFTCFQSWYGLLQIITEVFFAVIALVIISRKLALASLGFLVLPIFIPVLFKGLIEKAQKERLKKMNQHLSRFTEWVRSFELIRNSAATGRFFERFDEDSLELQNKSIRYNTLWNFARCMSSILVEISLLACLAFSSYLLMQGELNIAALYAAVAIMGELGGQVIYIAGYVQSIAVADVPYQNMLSVIHEEDPLQLPREQVKIAEVKDIEFRNVSFDYEGRQGRKRPLIAGFDAKVAETGVYWLKGTSGSGKSTLMNLLLRYYLPDDGEIRVNGVPLAKLADWEDHLAIMRQEVVFLDDSLRSNLCMYEDGIPDCELIEALRAVGLGEWANEEALDESLYHAEDRYSGGEARRMALVRTFLKPSEVLILDEPLANIDEESMRLICKLIFSLEDRYVFLISHQEPRLEAGAAMKEVWDLG